MNTDKWYTRSAQEVIVYWQTDQDEGLTSGEIKKRLSNFGYNEMIEKEKPAWWRRLVAQFQDFMVLVLLAATLISACLGEYVDAGNHTSDCDCECHFRVCTRIKG